MSTGVWQAACKCGAGSGPSPLTRVASHVRCALFVHRRGSSVHPAPSSTGPAAKRNLKRDSPDMLYSSLPFALWSALVRYALHVRVRCRKSITRGRPALTSPDHAIYYRRPCSAPPASLPPACACVRGAGALGADALPMHARCFARRSWSSTPSTTASCRTSPPWWPSRCAISMSA